MGTNFDGRRAFSPVPVLYYSDTVPARRITKHGTAQNETRSQLAVTNGQGRAVRNLFPKPKNQIISG
jgi:hypothetical protein